MPRIAKPLTAIELKRLTKPGLHPVGTVPGLRLRVRSTGARSWVLRKTIGTRRADLGLGSYPAVTLAQAIEYAREALHKIRSGTDPATEQRSRLARVRTLAPGRRRSKRRRTQASSGASGSTRPSFDQGLSVRIGAKREASPYGRKRANDPATASGRRDALL